LPIIPYTEGYICTDVLLLLPSEKPHDLTIRRDAEQGRHLFAAVSRLPRIISSYGSFQRSFQVPDDVDTDKIEATFKKGVLTVALTKSAEAQKAAKKIDVKAA
jgi:HSP20 family molecular chaperone IbpA